MRVRTVAVVAVTLFALGGAPAAHAETAGCRTQSTAGFPNAFTDPDNFVVGPGVFVFLRQATEASQAELDRFGGVKSPMLLRPGHTVVASIDPESRPFARLAYTFHERDRAQLEEFPHSVRFVSCPRRLASSRTSGERVTFWSGFWVVNRSPSCVRFHVSVDGRAPRPRAVPFGQPSC